MVRGFLSCDLVDEMSWVQVKEMRLMHVIYAYCLRTCDTQYDKDR